MITKDAVDFEPKHIFECGQCFRWNKEQDDSYTMVAHEHVINVKKDGDKIIFANTNNNDFDNIWYEYFDMSRDYGTIKKKLSKDEILKKSIEFGYGIRILKQDEWETLISFIISANNRIPRIKKSIEKLSEKYGKYLGEYFGKKYFGFPTAEKLSSLSSEEIKDCGTGFRAKYILSAAKSVASGRIDIYKLKDIKTKDARENLILFDGVGSKVSDCVMLFSMNKYDAFPVDVWVKRVMEYFYLSEDTKLRDIQKYAQDKFGDYAGFAQQYLFYYARELGIGKNK